MRGINSKLTSLKNDILEIKGLLQATECMTDEDKQKYINKCIDALLILSIDVDNIKSQTNEQSRDLQKILDMLIK